MYTAPIIYITLAGAPNPKKNNQGVRTDNLLMGSLLLCIDSVELVRNKTQQFDLMN